MEFDFGLYPTQSAQGNTLVYETDLSKAFWLVFRFDEVFSSELSCLASPLDCLVLH